MSGARIAASPRGTAAGGPAPAAREPNRIAESTIKATIATAGTPHFNQFDTPEADGAPDERP
jgi:hypothetical protein